MSTKKHGLDKEQQETAKRVYLATGDQKKAAKAIGVAKWRANLYFVEAKIGKRRKAPFWSQVDKMPGKTHKIRTQQAKMLPRWAIPRRAKEAAKYTRLAAQKAEERMYSKSWSYKQLPIGNRYCDFSTYALHTKAYTPFKVWQKAKVDVRELVRYYGDGFMSIGQQELLDQRRMDVIEAERALKPYAVKCIEMGEPEAKDYKGDEGEYLRYHANTKQ